MAKNSPILVVNRPRKTVKRKSTSSRSRTSSPKRRKQSKKQRGDRFPEWMQKLLLAVAAIVIAVACYWWLIRPYFYRWGKFDIPHKTNLYFPAGFTVYGIDFSHHQGKIDWNRMISELDKDSVTLQFVFLKATEGQSHLDKRYKENLKQARAHDLIPGAYHYFLPSVDPVEQADWFIRNVDLQSGDLPPVLDVEEYEAPLVLFQTNVLTWLKRVEQHYGVKPIIYTSYKFKESYLGTALFNEYPYWIAHYYVKEVSYKGKWHFWQHTDKGELPGVNEYVDLNVFNGDTDDLLKMTLP